MKKIISIQKLANMDYDDNYYDDMRSFTEKNHQNLQYVLEMLDKSQIDSKHTNPLFAKTMNILQHDKWFSHEQLDDVRNKALVFKFFSKKQKEQIRYPPIIIRREDRDDYC